MLQRLRTSYDPSGSVFNWFASYLCCIFVCVRSRYHCLAFHAQGSVLGPMLIYRRPAAACHFVKYHDLDLYACADDTQIFSFLPLIEADVHHYHRHYHYH